MATELTMAESLEREKTMIFRADLSESTLREQSHSRNCIAALAKQIPREVVIRDNYAYCPLCGRGQDYPGNIAIDVKAGVEIYCWRCGQRLTEVSGT